MRSRLVSCPLGLMISTVTLKLAYFSAPGQILKVSNLTEHATDLLLACNVSGLSSEERVIGATWYYLDQASGGYRKFFIVDFAHQRPSFKFAQRWTGKGQYEPRSLASIRLPSRFVTRDFGGEYRCQMKTETSQNFADIRVNVLYGPGRSIGITPGGRVERQEGDRVNLTCSSDCNPECSYRWYKSGRKIFSTAVLNLTSVSRNDAGLYACQSWNQVGRSIKPVDLRVLFPSTITSLNVTRAETANFVLTCEVSSWPRSTVEWKQGERQTSLVADNKTTFISSTQGSVEVTFSKLEIKAASCLNNYTCQAWNGLGEMSQKTIPLNVPCSPFVTQHNHLCKSQQEIEMTPKLYEELKIYLCFFGNPTPSVGLQHVSTIPSGISTKFGPVQCDWTAGQCQAVLILTVTSPDDYGDYVVTVSNNQGSFKKNYHILSQQAPLQPTKFVVTHVFSSSVCFMWNSNFNGGAKQKFHLQIHSASTEDIKLLLEEAALSNTSSLYSVCQHGLQPLMEYEASLEASNKYGASFASKVLHFTTLGVAVTWTPSKLFTVSNSSSPIVSVKKAMQSVKLVVPAQSSLELKEHREESDNTESEESEMSGEKQAIRLAYLPGSSSMVNNGSSHFTYSNVLFPYQTLVQRVHWTTNVGTWTTTTLSMSASMQASSSMFLASLAIPATSLATLCLVGTTITLTCLVQRRNREGKRILSANVQPVPSTPDDKDLRTSIERSLLPTPNMTNASITLSVPIVTRQATPITCACPTYINLDLTQASSHCCVDQEPSAESQSYVELYETLCCSPVQNTTWTSYFDNSDNSFSDHHQHSQVATVYQSQAMPDLEENSPACLDVTPAQKREMSDNEKIVSQQFRGSWLETVNQSFSQFSLYTNSKAITEVVHETEKNCFLCK